MGSDKGVSLSRFESSFAISRDMQNASIDLDRIDRLVQQNRLDEAELAAAG